jgi:hypothetical protein
MPQFTINQGVHLIFPHLDPFSLSDYQSLRATSPSAASSSPAAFGFRTPRFQQLIVHSPTAPTIHLAAEMTAAWK